MFLKAHLTIPYASLNHLYQTSCRIRLWFILFCFSFFTMCLCIFTQFVLFFLPNCRFEISTITEQLCYCWCLTHTRKGSGNKPTSTCDTCALNWGFGPDMGKSQRNLKRSSCSNLKKVVWSKCTTGRNKLLNNLQILLGKTICLITWLFKSKVCLMKELEKNNHFTTTFTFFLFRY